MLCIKCKEEIYENKICPFCGQNQNEEVPKTYNEEPELSFSDEIKSCINCSKTFSKDDLECQMCPAMKDKFLVDEVDEDDLRNITKKSNKKVGILVLMGVFVFIAILTLLIISFMSTANDISKATIATMEDNLEYFKDENGEVINEIKEPLDKEIAVEFITDTFEGLYDIQIELFVLLDSLNTYVTYNKFNIFENDCREINERIKVIRKKFKEIDTHDDRHLEGAKEYMYDKCFKPFYNYINTITQSIIDRNVKGLESVNIETQPTLNLGFAMNMSTINTRAGLSNEEFTELNRTLYNEFVEEIKPYLYRLPEKQRKPFLLVLEKVQ